MQSENSPSEPKRWKRKNRLPKPSLQLRLVGGFAGVASLALLAQSVYLGSLLLRLANELPTDGDILAQTASTLIGQALLVSFFALLPATLLIGVHLTFRTAGPIYRFERHLEQVAAGEDPGPCRIRKDDDLQELCCLLNDALTASREQGRREAERERTDQAA